MLSQCYRNIYQNAHMNHILIFHYFRFQSMSLLLDDETLSSLFTPRYMSFETCCLLRSCCSQFDQHANKYFLSLAEFNFKILPMENSIFSLSCYFWPSMYRRLFSTVTSRCRNLRKIHNLYTHRSSRVCPTEIDSWLSLLDHRLAQLSHLTHVHFLKFNVNPLNVAGLNQLPNLKSVAMETCTTSINLLKFILMFIFGTIFCSLGFNTILPL